MIWAEEILSPNNGHSEEHERVLMNMIWKSQSYKRD
jgi:hypothetical protein